MKKIDEGKGGMSCLSRSARGSLSCAALLICGVLPALAQVSTDKLPIRSDWSFESSETDKTFCKQLLSENVAGGVHILVPRDLEALAEDNYEIPSSCSGEPINRIIVHGAGVEPVPDLFRIGTKDIKIYNIKKSRMMSENTLILFSSSYVVLKKVSFVPHPDLSYTPVAGYVQFGEESCLPQCEGKLCMEVFERPGAITKSGVGLFSYGYFLFRNFDNIVELFRFDERGEYYSPTCRFEPSEGR
jgi:hypothetical protein